MTPALILDYLESQPEGTTVQQIADSINITAQKVRDVLARLETSGKVKCNGRRDRLGALWLSIRAETPPVFRAHETLKAMQDACRARLTANQMEAA
jgi:DNA-binding IclR family transcriptional regulator